MLKDCRIRLGGSSSDLEWLSKVTPDGPLKIWQEDETFFVSTDDLQGFQNEGEFKNAGDEFLRNLGILAWIEANRVSRALEPIEAQAFQYRAADGKWVSKVYASAHMVAELNVSFPNPRICLEAIQKLGVGREASDLARDAYAAVLMYIRVRSRGNLWLIYEALKKDVENWTIPQGGNWREALRIDDWFTKKIESRFRYWLNFANEGRHPPKFEIWNAARRGGDDSTRI